MIKEICVENFTIIPTALEAGANRIELCDNLAEGGTTVSLGVLKKTISYCHGNNIPVMTIIRPRGGNFVYTESEKEIMITDAEIAIKERSDGLVVGCLKKDGWIDEEIILSLSKIGKNHELTFHMAFDEIPKTRQKHAIDWLANHGFTRILTHGGDKNHSITEHLEWLKELSDYANHRIKILPGGGITWENCDEIAKYIGCQEVHGTQIVKYLPL